MGRRGWAVGPSPPPCGQLTRCFSAVAELLVANGELVESVSRQVLQPGEPTSGNGNISALAPILPFPVSTVVATSWHFLQSVKLCGLRSAVLTMIDSDCLSVHMSVTVRYHVKTTPAKIMRSSLEDSSITLVSSGLTPVRNSKENLIRERGRNRQF